MSEETTVVQKKEQTATTVQADASTATSEAEARIAELEVERNNYKIALAKEKDKNKSGDGIETEDEKIERIVSEKIAASKIAQIDTEKEAILKQALKENRELKLAGLNKTGIPPVALGGHNEGTPVTDTLITPEQMAYFKSKNYTDKDIERYKKNLQRAGGR